MHSIPNGFSLTWSFNNLKPSSTNYFYLFSNVPQLILWKSTAYYNYSSFIKSNGAN